jgi:hypothetical protein
MMEELLIELARTARNEQAVMTQQLANGMELMFYPLEYEMLVAIGLNYEHAQEVPLEDVLRRRAENMEQYGAWQPATMTDGSLYVARRVPDAGEDMLIAVDEVIAAQELLA